MIWLGGVIVALFLAVGIVGIFRQLRPTGNKRVETYYTPEDDTKP